MVHQEHFSLTGGFEAQVSTSKDNHGVLCDFSNTVCHFGFPENGYNPFASFRVTGGPLAFGGHAGYTLYDGSLGDVLNYDANTIWAITDNLAARVELTGYNQLKGKSQDILSVAPGLDLVVGHATFRVAGFKGITDDAADWGIGGGIALTFGGGKKEMTACGGCGAASACAHTGADAAGEEEDRAAQRPLRLRQGHDSLGRSSPSSTRRWRR